MVEDYVPDRLEFELASPTGKIAPDKPAEITLSGRFLYGAPAANLDLDRQYHRQRRKGTARFPRLSGSAPTSGWMPSSSRSTICRRPMTTARPRSRSSLDKLPTTERPLEARDHRPHRRIRRPRGRAQDHAAGHAGSRHDRRAAAVLRPLARRKRQCRLRRHHGAIPTASAIAKSGLRYELLRIETRYQWYRQNGYWNYEPVKSTPPHRRRQDRRVADGQPARISLPVTWGRYRLDVSDASGVVTHGRVRCRLLRRSQRRYARSSGNRARQAGIPRGRHHECRGHARAAPAA